MSLFGRRSAREAAAHEAQGASRAFEWAQKRMEERLSKQYKLGLSDGIVMLADFILDEGQAHEIPGTQSYHGEIPEELRAWLNEHREKARKTRALDAT